VARASQTGARLQSAACLLLAFAAGGCATSQPLRSSDPSQSVRGGEARVEQDGLRITAHTGTFGSWPDELEAWLTPVEVRLRNGTGAPLRIRPEQFSLVLDKGTRLVALSPSQVDDALHAVYPHPAQGSLQPTTLDELSILSNPMGVSVGPSIYSWSGLRGWGPSTGMTSGPPDPRPIPLGRLEQGGRAAFVVFFAVPADRLKSFTFVASVERADGSPLDPVRMPFGR
jgi:hypothetical protein